MTVNDSSIDLTVRQRPAHFRAEPNRGLITMRTSPLQVDARCKVEVDKSYVIPPPSAFVCTNPRLAPWKLGFMQVQILETAWAYYRGVQDDLGCVLNDTAARRQPTICRDYEPKKDTIWYEGSENIYDCYGLPDIRLSPPPWNLKFYFGDEPSHDVHPRVLNEQTHRSNYLHEARCAMAFVTTMTEEFAAGFYRHHRHFFWSLIWHIQATSAEPDKKNTDFKVLPGSGFWISEFKRGGPMNPRYRAVLDNSHITPSCNDVAESASVAKLTASKWQRFPLMDRKDRLF